MSDRRLFKRRRNRVLCVSAGTALVLTAGAVSGAVLRTTVASAATTPVTLSSAPLGLDVAPWDPLYSGTSAGGASTKAKVQALLKAAGVTQLHYGGGIAADEYDWQTNKSIANCQLSAAEPSVKTTAMFSDPTCAQTSALNFSTLSQNARGLGASTFVTVNYGTGTVAMATAWAAQAAAKASDAVAEFEVGNEDYGCWTDNEWLADPPANFANYQPNVPGTCPTAVQGQAVGMTTLATSYAANAGDYITAMAAADPNAAFGVPWAFDSTVGGASVGNNNIWNQTVETALATVAPGGRGFVDAHWYPGSWGYNSNTNGKDYTWGEQGQHGNPSSQSIIQSVETIPSEYAKIQKSLGLYDQGAAVVVGETGVSYRPTNVTCTPTGALFAAGDVLEWLSSGAQSIDWWPMDTSSNPTSTCSIPDEGMFTATGAPDTAYTGYSLAGQLTKPGATLSALSVTGASDVLAFQSVSNGQPVVALINTSTKGAETATVSTALTGSLATTTYSATDPANPNDPGSKTVVGGSTASAIANGISLPAESIMILKEAKPASMTLASGAASYKAGTKVSLTGALTLNGTAAPAGVTMKVYRRAKGSTVNAATLTVKTGAGGTFTATDVPSAHGTWDYVASYVSNTYQPATATAVVKVTQVAPSLKLASSAASVKPGKKVKVTATLGATHGNRTLVIYAQPKGGAKKIVARGTVNAKGQLSATVTVKVNTTFTVTFAGDSWYAAASQTATVKA